MGMKWIGFAIEIAWLIVGMAKQSGVATRRNHDAVNGPWVETHGYLQMSLRDICEQAIMLHEEFTACPVLLRGYQTVSITITMHTGYGLSPMCFPGWHALAGRAEAQATAPPL
jgi:hypothetical protein